MKQKNLNEKMDSITSRWCKSRKRLTSKNKQGKKNLGNKFQLKAFPSGKQVGHQQLRDEPEPGPSRIQLGPKKISNPLGPSTSSTSKRKIETFVSSQSSEPGDACKNYLFVHSSTWQELFKNLACAECGQKSLAGQMRERRGFAAQLCVKCEDCGFLSAQSFTSPRTTDNTKRRPFDVIRKMVEVFSESGGGHAQMQKFGATMGMSVMASQTSFAHSKRLADEGESLKEKVLVKARDAVRQAHVNRDEQVMKISTKILKERDTQRKRKSEWQNEARRKKLRRALKLTKAQLEALNIRKEETNYGAGQF